MTSYLQFTLDLRIMFQELRNQNKRSSDEQGYRAPSRQMRVVSCLSWPGPPGRTGLRKSMHTSQEVARCSQREFAATVRGALRARSTAPLDVEPGCARRGAPAPKRSDLPT